MTSAPPALTDASAKSIRVFVPAASPSLHEWARFFVFSDESSTEYAIRESASIAIPAPGMRSEARQRLATLRERSARRVRLLPFYEETATEIAERSIEHQALFQMQTRTRIWGGED